MGFWIKRDDNGKDSKLDVGTLYNVLGLTTAYEQNQLQSFVMEDLT